MNSLKARLALADGSIWRGAAMGRPGTRVGEVVFNTSMTGYQEILTDPSYAGQMVVMTAPQIGNTGVNVEDMESSRPFLSGLVVRELSPVPSNWRSESTLAAWMEAQGVLGIQGVDTRALTRRLRDGGSQKAVLTTDVEPSDGALVEQARAWAGLDDVDLAETVTCASSYAWLQGTPAGFRLATGDRGRYHVVVYDFGVKYSILRQLVDHHCRVTVVPARTTAEEVLRLNPDGVLLSNGPGDPAAVSYGVEAARQLLGKVPILGICLGHQILAQACGARTFRLKFGHHGGNQPVRNLLDGKVEISAHNHNFAVDTATLPAELEVTHVNLNDRCCEGFRHRTLPMMAVQYHPEAAPGPHDAHPLFEAWLSQIDWSRSQKVAV